MVNTTPQALPLQPLLYLQIYHEVFTHFLAAVDDDVELEPEIVDATAALMRSVSAICTTERQQSMRQNLGDILGGHQPVIFFNAR